LLSFKIKICGLTSREDVRNAIDCGADALGFIFGYDSSPRNLRLDQVSELTKNLPPKMNTVLVSPSSNPELDKAFRVVKPSYVQVYSNGSQRCTLSTSKVVQTVRPTTGNDPIARAVELSRASSAIIFDASTTSRYFRKTSSQFGFPNELDKWELGRKMRQALGEIPLILSGGLTPDNVVGAIKLAGPFAVDVSSGVEERPGIKDQHKMKVFIQRARSAFAKQKMKRGIGSNV
jgi:phosphoribosylanthranilate isomerase